MCRNRRDAPVADPGGPNAAGSSRPFADLPAAGGSACALPHSGPMSVRNKLDYQTWSVGDPASPASWLAGASDRPDLIALWSQSDVEKEKNHFVPRSYLRRFSSTSDRQIALYNIKSGIFALEAPIKSQCSRDYFYTKNPKFEDSYRAVEDKQKALFDYIIATHQVPASGSRDRSDLSACTIFQAGRTASTVSEADHMVNQFGKAALYHHLTKEGNTELLEFLPDLWIATIDVVIERIAEHLLMYPLIDDLDCTLLINHTSEDFLTSDHPVALCNSLPTTQNAQRNVGFASRGLIILYPISPRELLFFSDPEVYKLVNVGRGQPLNKKRDVVELNLIQFGSAYENVYFASVDRCGAMMQSC
jgi:hypothetical protein